MTRTPENPYRVLLGTSVALFLALALAVPLAWLGVTTYVVVTGVTPPVEIQPGVSLWELRLDEGEGAEELLAEARAEHPGARFRLSARADGTWLAVHAHDEAVFDATRRLARARGLGGDSFTLPTPFDALRGESLRAGLEWFGDHPAAIMATLSGPSASFALLGGLLLLLARRRSFTWADAPAARGRAVLAGLAGGVALTAASYLTAQLSGLLGRPVVEQEWLTTILERGGQTSGALWVLLAGLAPLGEELFFRGWLFQTLDVRVSRPVAYGISVAYFAGVHFNPSGLLVYVVMGLGLAFLYARTRTLVAPVVAHAVVNALALAAG